MMKNPETPAGEGNLHQTPVLTPTSPRLCENELSPLARELRAALKVSDEQQPSPRGRLEHQAATLDALFSVLMLKGTATNGEDERFSIALALKAQQQCLGTLVALHEILGKRHT